MFFNQLFGGRHSKAVLGDLLAVMLNNSMATYKISGPLVAVEKEILSQVDLSTLEQQKENYFDNTLGHGIIDLLYSVSLVRMMVTLCFCLSISCFSNIV